MLRIYNPNISQQQIGGGWTFRNNLQLALKDQVQFVDRIEECDILLITSVTLVAESDVKNAKTSQKKIVLRVDNMPRKSRNRMSPHERMKEYAAMADEVIYQSKWAQEWIGSYLGISGQVINNGVDTSIFKPVPRQENDDKKFLIIQYNRDENKRMPEAFDMFTKEWLKNRNHRLVIVGRFSPELISADFDFFRGEPYIYMGIIEDRNLLAQVMQKTDILLYPSYSDALPNTVIEARACGMEVWHHGHAGVSEAATIPDPSLERMGREYLEVFNRIMNVEL